MTILAALNAEIASLEKELSENVTYKRLQVAKQMAALYEPAAPHQFPPTAPHVPATPLPRPRMIVVPRRAGNPERAKALDAARMFLSNRTAEPTPTAEIYDHISGLGIEIGGSDPRNNLSAMLSNSPIFQSHGRAGWTLASMMKPDDAGRAEDMTEEEVASFNLPPRRPLV